MNQHRHWQKFLAASAAVLLAMLATVPVVRAENLDEVEAETLVDPVDAYFNSLRVFGLTNDSRLVRFRISVPHFSRNIGTVSGLSSLDSALVCIDFRVQDGKLYGVGNGGGVYTINTKNARATLVNSLTVPLEGPLSGVTSIRRLTVCGSSATPARISGTM